MKASVISRWNTTRHASAQRAPLRTETAVCTFGWILSLPIFCSFVVTGRGATGIRIDVAGISLSYCGECRTRDKLKQVLEPAFEITHVESGKVSQCRSDIRLPFLLHRMFQLLTISSDIKWRRRCVFLDYSELGSNELPETSVSVCQSARRHVPEDLNVYQRRCWNLNRCVWMRCKCRYCRVKTVTNLYIAQKVRRFRNTR